MELFYATLSVVMGILTPFIVVAVALFLVWLVTELVKQRRIQLETILEEATKEPPYDNIELSQPPNPTMFSIRLIKNGESVWEGSYNKGDPTS